MPKQPKSRPAHAGEIATQPPPEPETRDDELFQIPRDMTYDMNIWVPDGDCLQTIQTTRAEHIALRKHLAGLRGLKWPEDEAQAAA